MTVHPIGLETYFIYVRDSSHESYGARYVAVTHDNRFWRAAWEKRQVVGELIIYLQAHNADRPIVIKIIDETKETKDGTM